MTDYKAGDRVRALVDLYEINEISNDDEVLTLMCKKDTELVIRSVGRGGLRRLQVSIVSEVPADKTFAVDDVEVEPEDIYLERTKQEFIDAYCKRSNIPWKELSKYRVVERCDCGDKICTGWVMMWRERN